MAYRATDPGIPDAKLGDGVLKHRARRPMRPDEGLGFPCEHRAVA